MKIAVPQVGVQSRDLLWRLIDGENDKSNWWIYKKYHEKDEILCTPSLWGFPFRGWQPQHQLHLIRRHHTERFALWTLKWSLDGKEFNLEGFRDQTVGCHVRTPRSTKRWNSRRRNVIFLRCGTIHGGHPCFPTEFDWKGIWHKSHSHSQSRERTNGSKVYPKEFGVMDPLFPWTLSFPLADQWDQHQSHLILLVEIFYFLLAFWACNPRCFLHCYWAHAHTHNIGVAYTCTCIYACTLNFDLDFPFLKQHKHRLTVFRLKIGFLRISFQISRQSMRACLPIMMLQCQISWGTRRIEMMGPVIS